MILIRYACTPKVNCNLSALISRFPSRSDYSARQQSTCADLARLLQAQGWRKPSAKHLRYGGKVLGICGGFQMLGERR